MNLYGIKSTESLLSNNFLINLVLFILLSSGFGSHAFAQPLFENSSIEIAPISINSKNSDFGPEVVEGKLWFSAHNDKGGRIKKNTSGNYDLFSSPIDKHGKTSQKIPVEELLTPFNDGPVSWCEKTGELFITQNFIEKSFVRKNVQEEVVRLKIIIVKKIEGKWIRTGEFPFYSSDYSVAHPAVNSEGDTLVFSSNMPGGYGESDLWYSVRKDGKWSAPVNPGPAINTPGSESFPYISQNKTNGSWLVFSSNGRTGYGGLDLYYARFPADFREIYHFAKPLNSEFDDFSMIIPANEEIGYFTSNRSGNGDDDIYRFTYRFADKKLQQHKFREIYFFGKENHKPIPDVRLLTSDKKLYISDYSGRISSYPCNEKDGILNATALGYFSTFILKATDPKYEGIIKDTIWMNVDNDRKIILKNVWFNLDKSEILPASEKELNILLRFLNDNPNQSIQIENHTDDKGSYQYNFELSTRRAHAIADYLYSMGVEKTRISAKGMGKSKPIHKCPPGIPCSPAQRQENKRTEIIIIPNIVPVSPVISEKENIKNFQLYPDKDTKDDPIKSKKQTFGYYLILKSFNNRAQAVDFLQKALSEGLKVTLLEQNKNYRIAIGYNSQNIASRARDYFKEKYPSCWIWKFDN